MLVGLICKEIGRIDNYNIFYQEMIFYYIFLHFTLFWYFSYHDLKNKMYVYLLLQFNILILTMII